MKWLLILLAATARAHTGTAPTMTCHDISAVAAQMAEAAELCDKSWKNRPAWDVKIPTPEHCSNSQEVIGKWNEEGSDAFIKEVKEKGAVAACAEADDIMTKIEALR